MTNCNAGQAEFDYVNERSNTVKCRADGAYFDSPAAFRVEHANKSNVR